MSEKKRPFKFTLGASIRQERVLHGGESSAEDIEAINKLTLNPVTEKDVAVFRMDLCNDQIDRHISCFPVKELKHINDELIVGKPLMELHDMPGPFNRGSQPVGKFFRSQLVEENGTVSVRPDVYLLRGHGEDDLIAKIEAGILSGTSISFALNLPECSICGSDIQDCAHWPGEEEEDGEVCHVVLKDVTDVFEGSIVPLGSQGTEFVEARGVDGDGEPVLPLKDAIKQARGTALATSADTWEFTEGGRAYTARVTTTDSIGIGDTPIARIVVEPETHPGDETDDELRTTIEEDLERVRKIPSTFYKDPTN